MMKRNARMALRTLSFIFVFVLSGYGRVPGSDHTFDRTLTVNGPIRLELSTGSGDVQIKGGTDGKVHIRGEVHAGWSLFGDAQKRIEQVVANPPIEQRGDAIRIGKDSSLFKNTSISYVIEVPHESELSVNVASGEVNVAGVRGPVKLETASGSIRVEKIDREAELSSASGSITASDLGDFARASSASGDVSISNIKGEVRINVASGEIRVVKPGNRVEASTASGSIAVQGANGDVKAHSLSGRVAVTGNPSGNSYWDLKTVSGSVELSVPPGTNFRLSGESTSGEVRADIPIVIEEQGKHSLRAHIGNGGGRVEVHTVSGEIRVRGTS
jgi:DUF4097 and DUF4098 domain-containing protein YvlB